MVQERGQTKDQEMIQEKRHIEGRGKLLQNHQEKGHPEGHEKALLIETEGDPKKGQQGDQEKGLQGDL